MEAEQEIPCNVDTCKNISDNLKDAKEHRRVHFNYKLACPYDSCHHIFIYEATYKQHYGSVHLPKLQRGDKKKKVPAANKNVMFNGRFTLTVEAAAAAVGWSLMLAEQTFKEALADGIWRDFMDGKIHGSNVDSAASTHQYNDMQLFKQLEEGGVSVELPWEKVTTLFNYARLLEQLHDAEKTTILYRLILFKYPNYLDAYLRLAAIAKARNNIQLSIELIGNALKVNGKCLNSLSMLGNLELKSDDWVKAKDTFRAAKEATDGKDSFATLSLGNWNYFAAVRSEKRGPKLEATHLEKAKELYTKVLVDRPANLYAANGTGVILAEKGQFDVSKDIYTHVQEAASGSIFVQMPDVWINLAHIYFAQGQFSLAVKMYQNCLRKFYYNTDSQVLLYLAHTHYEAEQWQDCKKTLLRAIHLAPSNYTLRFDAGVSMQKFSASTLQKRTADEVVGDTTIHLCETEALKAVSTYRQKFGQTLLSNRLPRPITLQKVSSSFTTGSVGIVCPSIAVQSAGTAATLHVGSSSGETPGVSKTVGQLNFYLRPVLRAPAKNGDPRLWLAQQELVPVDVNQLHSLSTPANQPTGGKVNSRKHNIAPKSPFHDRTFRILRNGFTDIEVSSDAHLVPHGWSQDYQDRCTFDYLPVDRIHQKEQNGTGLGKQKKRETSSADIQHPSTGIFNVRIGGNKQVTELNTSTTTSTVYVPSLMKKVVVNTTNSLQNSGDPAQIATLPPTNSSMMQRTGPLLNVGSSKSLDIEQNPTERSPVTAQTVPMNLMGEHGFLEQK